MSVKKVPGSRKFVFLTALCVVATTFSVVAIVVEDLGILVAAICAVLLVVSWVGWIAAASNYWVASITADAQPPEAPEDSEEWSRQHGRR